MTATPVFSVEEWLRGQLSFRFSLEERGRISLAWEVTTDLFYGMVRRDGTKAITHSMRTAQYVRDLIPDPDVIIAAILHDVLEDTKKMTGTRLVELFGPDHGQGIVFRVQALTRDENNPDAYYDQILAAVAACWDIIVIKLCDKLDNHTVPYGKSARKEIEYIREKAD